MKVMKIEGKGSREAADKKQCALVTNRIVAACCGLGPCDVGSPAYLTD
jgi:hypothetical protein